MKTDQEIKKEINNLKSNIKAATDALESNQISIMKHKEQVSALEWVLEWDSDSGK